MHGQSSHGWKGGHKGKKVEDATLMRAAQQFLEGQKELAAASKPVAIKKANLSLPTGQEGTVAEGQGQVRSRSVVESEEGEEEDVQMTPVARAKQHCLETEVGTQAEVKAKRLALGKVGEGDKDNNNDNNNNDREETPLAERAVVAKAIARSLDEGEAEARPEAGPGDDR